MILSHFEDKASTGEMHISSSPFVNSSFFVSPAVLIFQVQSVLALQSRRGSMEEERRRKSVTGSQRRRKKKQNNHVSPTCKIRKKILQ